MKPLLRSFHMFILQIAGDSMLYIVCAAPLLAALFFRFGIPYIEVLLCAYFGKSAILSVYYLLFDLSLCTVTPFLFCFASSMVILTEYDDNMMGYLAVTPVGRKGYLISRFLFPSIISFFVSMTLLSLFSLTVWSLFSLITACLLTSILSIAVSLLVVSFSHNRVEGMAVTKMSGIMMMGLVVPFFLTSGFQYLFSVLPSFWIAKQFIEKNPVYGIPALLTAFLWILLFYRRFSRK